jgi:phenylpyruvate tautomerase PptA (4-oxalocrotonate tautomerase family)
MPTITIHGGPSANQQRRATAARITRWLAAHGCNRQHVIVRFVDIADDAYVGGIPASFAYRDRPQPLATAVCCIAAERDQEFRRGLAGVLAECLDVQNRTGLLHIEFRPTARDDVVLASQAELSFASAL